MYMDNDLTLGIDPEELAAAAAAEADTTSEINPAANIANAAMMGAKPVVTTTELNAMDAPAEPVVQFNEAGLANMALDSARNESLGTPNLVPSPDLTNSVDTDSNSIAPSSDFQIGEVSTISATPNTDNNPLENSLDDLTNFQNNGIDDATREQLKTINNNNEAPARMLNDETIESEPIIAAAPVPGSIGSAKSYIDIQRAEAEKAAKVAAKKGGKVKLSKNAILGIIVAVLTVVFIGIGAIIVFSNDSADTKPASSSAANMPQKETHEISTLTCRRQLAAEDYGAFAAKSGTYENIFYFKDGALDGLITNLSYTYSDAATAKKMRDKFMEFYHLNKEGRAGEEHEAEKSEKVADEKTDEKEKSDESKDDKKDSEEVADDFTDEKSEETDEEKSSEKLLKNYIMLDNLTLTHGMEIKSEDIEAWLASGSYSDRTYGASDNETENTEEPTRDLDFYKSLQNKIGFTCDIVKGN